MRSIGKINFFYNFYICAYLYSNFSYDIKDKVKLTSFVVCSNSGNYSALYIYIGLFIYEIGQI